MSTSSSDLLKLVDADFALLSIDDKTRAIGMLDPYQEALAIISYLQSCRFTSIRSSHNIKADFPGLSYSPGLNAISGLLIIPLNVKEGNHFLVFFRKTLTREVNWAGYVETYGSPIHFETLDRAVLTPLRSVEIRTTKSSKVVAIILSRGLVSSDGGKLLPAPAKNGPKTSVSWFVDHKDATDTNYSGHSFGVGNAVQQNDRYLAAKGDSN